MSLVGYYEWATHLQPLDEFPDTGKIMGKKASELLLPTKFCPRTSWIKAMLKQNNNNNSFAMATDSRSLFGRHTSYHLFNPQNHICRWSYLFLFLLRPLLSFHLSLSIFIRLSIMRFGSFHNDSVRSVVYTNWLSFVFAHSSILSPSRTAS